VRAQGFEAQALGVHGELPPTGFIGPASVRGRGAGDESAGVATARATCGEDKDGTSIMLSVLLLGVTGEFGLYRTLRV
jgi:hypothetical protein